MEIDFDGAAGDKFGRVPCPRCGRLLDCVGMIAGHGETPTPVYQCEACVTPFEMEGETFDAVYTFTLDAAGRPVDHQLGSDPSFN
jgi:hypothetical protein